MKELGTGFGDGVWFRNIEVVRTSGRPAIILHGGARARADETGPTPLAPVAHPHRDPGDEVGC